MLPNFYTSKRSWFTFVFLLALLFSIFGISIYKNSNALSLGKIEVLSSIGDPLKAYVQIGSASKEELSALKINLASPDFFRKAGVAYNPVLKSLLFSLVEKPQGFVIEITSQSIIKDPYLDILLDVSWAGGRLVREYTALLDVTDTSDDEAKTAEQSPILPTKITLETPSLEKGGAETIKAADVVAKKVTVDEFKDMAPISEGERIDVGAESTFVKQTAKKMQSSYQDAADFYFVRPGDSLSKIAAPIAKSANVSLDQVIFLLYNDNRDRLARNLDYLEVNTRLKLPSDPSLLQLVPKGEARRFVLAQSRNFSKYQQTLASVAKKKRDYSGNKALSSGKVAENRSTQLAVANTKMVSNELLLTSPTNPAAKGSGEDVVPSSAKPSQEEKIAMSTSSVQARLDINQLQSNIAEGSVLAVKTGEMRSSESMVEHKVNASVAATQVAEPVVDTEVKADFFSELLSDDYTLYAIAGLLIVGLIGFSVLNRKKKSNSQNQTSVNQSDDSDDDWTPPPFKNNQSTMNEFRSHPSVSSSAFEPSSTLRESSSVVQKFESLEKKTVETDSLVSLAEVDTLMQYQQFKEAEELLLTHLRARPDSIVLKQKLAKVYVALGNKDGFESLLSEFLQSASPDVDWTALAELQALMDTKQSQQLSKKQISTDTQSMSDKSSISVSPQFESLDPSSLSTEENGRAELSKTKFDFSSIDLSLDDIEKQSTGFEKPAEDKNQIKNLDDPFADSLSTKLELARAYKDIGDISGARQLFQEVASSGKSEFMDRAKAGLESLGSL